jgi:mannan endo-1,4-beta-mannosidase
VKPLVLNLATGSATLVLLVVLALPAWTLHGSSNASAVAPANGRLFGVYTDPWHLDDWSAHVGVRPNLVAKFEAFARRRTPGKFLRQVERDGVTRVMISWEPWKPVPAALGAEAQARQQPGFTNADVASGSRDGYITRFARSVAAFRGIVYMRYAHEMNGFWYPWSAGARAYVRAWRHLVRIFRREGAANARFVWSANPNLYESQAEWLANLRRYWPGRRWVDVVGSTVINFGGEKKYWVRRFTPRLSALHRVFRKPLFLTEVNTERETRIAWLRELERALHGRPWIRALAWSQLPSRAKAQGEKIRGDLNWDVARDPPAAAQLRAVALDESR